MRAAPTMIHSVLVRGYLVFYTTFLIRLENTQVAPGDDRRLHVTGYTHWPPLGERSVVCNLELRSHLRHEG